MKITKQWAKKRGFLVNSYSLQRWEYKDEDGIKHLIHDGVEVAKGKSVCSYSLRRWDYEDDDRIWHEVDLNNKNLK